LLSTDFYDRYNETGRELFVVTLPYFYGCGETCAALHGFVQKWVGYYVADSTFSFIRIDPLFSASSDRATGL
jgi:hypothetical protein